jgi:hypothetical protein
MEESKKKRDRKIKTDNSETETGEEAFQDFDKKQRVNTYAEIVAEMMRQQGYTPPDLEMPSLNDDPELPPLPLNNPQFPPWIGYS